MKYFTRYFYKVNKFVKDKFVKDQFVKDKFLKDKFVKDKFLKDENKNIKLLTDLPLIGATESHHLPTFIKK